MSFCSTSQSQLLKFVWNSKAKFLRMLQLSLKFCSTNGPHRGKVYKSKVITMIVMNLTSVKFELLFNNPASGNSLFSTLFGPKMHQRLSFYFVKLH